jgi:hypothetical protein
MLPLTRVAAAGLLVGFVAGALALRPNVALTPPGTDAAELAMGDSRLEAASRHRAYLRSRALLAAARPVHVVTPPAARPAVPALPAMVRQTAPVVTRSATAASYLTRGRRIYSSFHYDLGRLGFRVVFKPASQGLLGLTDSRARTITIYVRSTESDVVLAHSIGHEMGHALDFSRGSSAKSQLYLTIRHLSPSLDWFGCNSCSDYATPAGDWAEVFAQWLAGPGDFRSQLAGPPTSGQLVLLGPLFRL